MAASHGFAEQVEDFSFLSDALVYQLHCHWWLKRPVLFFFCWIYVTCILFYLRKLHWTMILRCLVSWSAGVAEATRWRREDRGGLYSGQTLHQQDEVRGKNSDAALQPTGNLPGGKQQETGWDRKPAFCLQVAHTAGEHIDQLHSISIACFTVVLMTCALLVLQICCNSFWKDEYVFLDSWYFIISDCDRLYFPVYRRQQIVIDMKSWTRKLPN